MKLARLLVGALCLVAALAGCGREEATTPEARIRALIDRVVAGAEAGEIDPLQDALGDGFRAEGGLDREQIIDRVRLYLLRYRTVHLLTRVESITVASDGLARAELLLGAAARPIESASVLRGYRGSVHRVALQLERTDGAWTVHYAEWTRVSPGELIRLM